jgi:two-component system response regulator FlrC
VIGPAQIHFEALTGSLALRVAPQVPVAAASRDDGRGELRGSLRLTERDLIMDALGAGASRRDVADRLGISARTLRYKLARLRATGVDIPAA